MEWGVVQIAIGTAVAGGNAAMAMRRLMGRQAGDVMSTARAVGSHRSVSHTKGNPHGF